MALHGEGRYRRQLDALRAFAVLAVLYQHFWNPDMGEAGRFGVRLFFVISGYLITGLFLASKPAHGQSSVGALATFYSRRALRILPAYYLALSLALALNVQGVRDTIWWHAFFGSNVLFALRNDWDPWPLAHLWTLSIEQQFYLFWPALILPTPQRLLPLLLAAVVAGSVLYRWSLAGDVSGDAREWVLTLASLDALAAGGLLAALENAGRPLSAAFRRGLNFAGALSAILLVSGMIFGVSLAFDYVVGQLLIVVAASALVSSAAGGVGGMAGSILDWWVLRALGRISYGVYLYHLILLAIVFDLCAALALPLPEAGPVRFGVLTALTAAIAAISWRFVEEPLLRLKRKLPYGTSAKTIVGDR